MHTDWATALPHPIGFVLSGGASLGAIQVGMLTALAEVGLEPDLVAGTSAGSLNAVVVAEHADLHDATRVLTDTWQSLRRHDVFPGGTVAAAWSVLRTGYLYSGEPVARLIRRTLRARTFADLERDLTVVTVDVLSGHEHWHRQGNLVPVLRAATAIPGVIPPQVIDGRHHWDAGAVANVPLQAAIDAGAASLVVLDAGDVCHLDQVPRGLPDALLHNVMVATRQRALVEAPMVATRLPVLYLPRPCASNRSLLDLDSSATLIDPTAEVVRQFLADVDAPEPGRLVGTPHGHLDAVVR